MLPRVLRERVVPERLEPLDLVGVLRVVLRFFFVVVRTGVDVLLTVDVLPLEVRRGVPTARTPEVSVTVVTTTPLSQRERGDVSRS